MNGDSGRSGDAHIPPNEPPASAPYRPPTLAQTATAMRAARDSESDPFLDVRDFVDAYRREAPANRPLLTAEVPPSTGDARLDAYLAGVAEHFARLDGYRPPPWSEEASRFLSHAWFREPRQGFWPMALAQSPLAFRRRLVFIEASEFERL